MTERRGGAKPKAKRQAKDSSHPKLRSRRQEVAASRWRRRGTYAIGAVACVGALVGFWFLAHTSLLSVQEVTVVGVQHATAKEVRDASGLRSHPAMLTLSSAAVSERVGKLPWVASVEVQRHWPNGVTLVVHERVPVAAIERGRGGFVLADASGRLLQDVADPGGLPTVTRVQALGPVGSTVRRPTSGALKVAARLPVAFRDQVVGVDATAKGAIRLRLSSPVVVLLGLPVHLPSKFTAVASVLAGAELHPGDVVDVTVPSTPVIKGP